MGSCGASHFVEGNQQAEKAYNFAVQEALRSDGDDPYNGTISTSSGIRIFHTVPQTWPEARAIEEREMDNLTKWESWGAVPIVSKDSSETRVIEKRFSLTTASVYPHELQGIIAPQVPLKPGESIESVEILEDHKVWKPVIETPAGDRQVKYVVSGVNSLGRQRFDTLAEARAAASDVAKTWGTPVPGYNGKPIVSWGQDQPMAATIWGVVDRGDAVPMLKVGTTIKSRNVKLKITLSRAKDRKLGGWYFFGWAAM